MSTKLIREMGVHNKHLYEDDDWAGSTMNMRFITEREREREK